MRSHVDGAPHQIAPRLFAPRPFAPRPFAPRPISRRQIAVVVAVALLMVLIPAVTSAGREDGRALAVPTAATPGTAVAGWAPHWSLDEAVTAIEANSALMGEVSPFWFTARAGAGEVAISSAVSQAARERVRTRLRASGSDILPSVADGSAAGAMARILRDPGDRAAHVAQLVDLAAPYDGIELDYEKFAFADGRDTWAATRPAWVAFVKELSTALHRQGLRLALAVPAMYDSSRSTRSGYWVYDYAGIADSIDSLRIMTYDFSVSRPGPISPPSFLRRTLDFAVTAVPPAKIRMGVPAYGRLWVARKADGSQAITGKCPTSTPLATRSFTVDEAKAVLRERAGGASIKQRTDRAAQERVATFTRKYSGKGADGSATSCSVRYEAWWVDSAGVSSRLGLVGDYGLAGVAVWQLAGVDKATWKVLHDFAGSLKPPPTVLGLAVAGVSAYGAPLELTATVATAKGPLAGVPVALQKRKPGQRRWRSVGSATSNAAGRAAFRVTTPSTTTRWRAVVAEGPRVLPAAARAQTKVAAAIEVAAVSASKGRARVSAQVHPKRKGVRLRLEVQAGEQWQRVAAKRTDRRGRARFTVKAGADRQPPVVRVVSSRRGSLQPGASAPVTLPARASVQEGK